MKLHLQTQGPKWRRRAASPATWCSPDHFPVCIDLKNWIAGGNSWYVGVTIKPVKLKVIGRLMAFRNTIIERFSTNIRSDSVVIKIHGSIVGRITPSGFMSTPESQSLLAVTGEQ